MQHSQATDGTVNLLREYIWLNAHPFAVIEDGEVFWLSWDHINRPVMATDATGAVVWQASYTPFGGIRDVSVDTGALSAQEHRFPGQWFQAETGYHQNWHRDYDPTTGRYLQADPLGLIDGASVYGYALQSPLRHADPRGLQAGSGSGTMDGGMSLPNIPDLLKLCVRIGSGALAGISYAFNGSGLVCSTNDCSIVFNRPPGYWPGDSGAREWGRRHGNGPRDGREKFHDLKHDTPGSGADEDMSVNPDTGDVIDSNGESVGNLFDE